MLSISDLVVVVVAVIVASLFVIVKLSRTNSRLVKTNKTISRYLLLTTLEIGSLILSPVDHKIIIENEDHVLVPKKDFQELFDNLRAISANVVVRSRT